MVPTKNAIQAGQQAASRMADRNTSFIYNEWYVAAQSSELGHALLARTILGKRIVMYRTEDGTPIALADRCAHRSFPLSAGTLEGDTIVCGYHGFRYNTAGDWVEVPAQPRCPKGIGVRSYKLIESGKLIWVWMGEAAEATPDTLPMQDWMQTWKVQTGYLHLPGNYVSLHENLLDLTHLSYIHAKSFGTPDYARAPFTVDIQGTSFSVTRRVIPTTLPPIWAKSTGLGTSPTSARIARSEYVSPGYHLTSTDFYETTLPEDTRPEFHANAAHFPTPETNESTHYFILDGRDFALDDPSIGDFMHQQLLSVFKEDVAALSILETVLREPDPDAYEISVASDAPAVAMRRHLKSRAMAEQAATAAKLAANPAAAA
jgi:phenylpropionate dioxygenase-like ring-hydroxylating dioxygenase large terminal subunit